MAFNPKPSTWLGAGYTTDSGAHTVTFNTNDAASNKLLKRLTDALADPTTGDIRDVVLAVSEAFYQAWLTIAGTPANLPTKMTIARIASTPSSGVTVFKYAFTFTINTSAFTTTSE